MCQNSDDDAGSENQSDKSEEDDYIDDLPADLLAQKGKDMRTSVSAEAFGVFNKKDDFKAPNYPKSEAVK